MPASLPDPPALGDATGRDTATAAPVLELAGYAVRFTTPGGVVTAAADIDLRVEAGQTLAVVGESGSGKSQTFNGVFGLLARNGAGATWPWCSRTR